MNTHIPKQYLKYIHKHETLKCVRNFNIIFIGKMLLHLLVIYIQNILRKNFLISVILRGNF